MSHTTEAPDFLRSPDTRPAIRSFIPEAEDLDLTKEQIDFASGVLISYVQHQMHIQQSPRFKIDLYLGGNISIDYRDLEHMDEVGLSGLKVVRYGNFSLGVTEENHFEDNGIITERHIFFEDRNRKKVIDSRNTLLAINGALPLALPYRDGHPSSDDRTEYLDWLRQSFRARQAQQATQAA